MTGMSLWDAIRRRVGSNDTQAHLINLQVVGLDADDLRQLRPVFDKLGERLAVSFEFKQRDGDVLLVDAEYAARAQAQLNRLLRSKRPVVMLGSMDDAESRILSAAASFERVQQQLLCQLREIPVVLSRSARWRTSGWPPELSAERRDAPASVPRTESAFDSELDAEITAKQLRSAVLEEPLRQFILQVLHGLHDERTPRLTASYGPDAHLRFDFRSRLVLMDPQALQGLRVKRQLPQIDAQAQPCADALSYDLEAIVWDLGMNCGRFNLMNGPDEFWHASLLDVAANQVERYSRQPRHLAVARRMVVGPATPAELRRDINISVEDLRRFIQACLFLGLLRWAN